MKTLHAALSSHGGGGTEKEEASGIANIKSDSKEVTVLAVSATLQYTLKGLRGAVPRRVSLVALEKHL